MGAAQVHALRQLARHYGIQTAYYDVTRRRRQASPESLLRTLRALGAPLESVKDVPGALRERRQSLWKRGTEPVVVAWEGRPAELEFRVPQDRATGSVACHLMLETGEVRNWVCEVDRLRTKQTVAVEGVRYVAKRLPLPRPLPLGYHRLNLHTRGRLLESLIISARSRAYSSDDESARRAWGLFLPLYALHSKRSWGGGDLTDLETLMNWVATLGGSVVGTLPLLAAFLDEPYDPSPYAPASRLFWNEFYIDVTRIPEFQTCPAAQALLESGEIQRELDALRSSSLIDYRRQMALKRRVLEELVRCFFAETTERQPAFRRFVEDCPQVEDYARFRATGERQSAPWPSWPERLRSGDLKEGDYGETARRYHLYVQWVAHEQIKALSEKGGSAGVGLYLDLPLGVHPYSYDVWREREAFALDVSGGAPPDVVFTKGQDWGFPPLHPEAIREQRYRYFITYLRHQLKYTSLLRIDHVMALHRLFWIPKGLEPRDGVYVRYPAEDLYAIVSLESYRHRSSIVGENLGTVPGYVNGAMARHRVQQMYVVQYELNPGVRRVLRVVPHDAVASLNTHDMPPFAAYWECLDIEDRVELDLLSFRGARLERKNRRALQQALEAFLRRQGWLKARSVGPQALLQGCLRFLSASSARVLLVNVEDLWLETQPQNVPATHGERPNWQRKARHTIEAICGMPTLCGILRDVGGLRRDANRSGPRNFKTRQRGRGP